MTALYRGRPNRSTLDRPILQWSTLDRLQGVDPISPSFLQGLGAQMRLGSPVGARPPYLYPCYLHTVTNHVTCPPAAETTSFSAESLLLCFGGP